MRKWLLFQALIAKGDRFLIIIIHCYFLQALDVSPKEKASSFILNLLPYWSMTPCSLFFRSFVYL